MRVHTLLLAAAMAATASDGAITVDKTMLASIKVATVGEGESANMLSIAGKVQFDEDRVARVLAPLSGQVVGLRVKVGDPVRKGQELCALNSRDAAAAVGEHIESRKDVELAEKNAAMTQDLFDHEAASKMALQQAQNDLAKARARVARTEEALRVLGLTAHDDLSKFNGRVPLTAPIAGVVVERKVTEGQFVQSDSTPLLTVANLDAVWVVGDLFERDLRLVGNGQAATTRAFEAGNVCGDRAERRRARAGAERAGGCDLHGRPTQLRLCRSRCGAVRKASDRCRAERRRRTARRRRPSRRRSRRG